MPKRIKPKKKSELDEAIESYKKAKANRDKLKVEDVQNLLKDFKTVVSTTKRAVQKLEQEARAKKPSRTSRSGLKRGVIQKSVYTDGKLVNKGIDDAQRNDLDAEELDYLSKTSKKVKNVSELAYDHLRYLIVYEFLDELKAIQRGEVQSDFHDRYQELGGKSKSDLLSEIRTSLFTNEQRDYINGLLQGAFDTTSKDNNGDIKHTEINYVEVVMLAEATVRIVKYVNKFDTFQETFAFMKKRSREAHGISDDDD